MRKPIIRLTIYLLVVTLSTLQNELANITTEIWSSYTWLDFIKLFIATVIPPLITLRAFIDQSGKPPLQEKRSTVK